MFERFYDWLDSGTRYELLDMVESEVGYNRDVGVDEELFEDCDRLERSRRTYVDRIFDGAKVYRDDKPRTSLHVTDFRDSNINGVGAHLEYFNPEHHPILHLLDVALWHIKNIVENREEKEI